MTEPDEQPRAAVGLKRPSSRVTALEVLRVVLFLPPLIGAGSVAGYGIQHGVVSLVVWAVLICLCSLGSFYLYMFRRPIG